MKIKYVGLTLCFLCFIGANNNVFSLDNGFLEEGINYRKIENYKKQSMTYMAYGVSQIALSSVVHYALTANFDPTDGIGESHISPENYNNLSHAFYYKQYPYKQGVKMLDENIDSTVNMPLLVNFLLLSNGIKNTCYGLWYGMRYLASLTYEGHKKVSLAKKTF